MIFCHLFLCLGLKPTIEKHIFHYSYYNFLWKDDMNCQYTELTSVNRELLVINKVVERIHKIEQKIQDFSPVYTVFFLVYKKIKYPRAIALWVGRTVFGRQNGTVFNMMSARWLNCPPWRLALILLRKLGMEICNKVFSRVAL